MPCYINIEDRYNCRSLKARQQFNVFAATATALGASAAVAGAIGAGTTAAIGAGATLAASSMQSKAAGKAAAGQASAMKKARRQEKKAAKGFQMGQAQIEADLGQIQAPVFNLGQDIAGARDISAYYREELEKFLPGAAAQREKGTQQLNQAMDVIGTYLRGEIPQDVKDQLMRNIAEMGGAGFAPAAAGRGAFVQGPQANLARSLGLTSLDIQGRGLTAAPQIQASAQRWNELAERFRAEPLDVSRMSLAYQMGGADVGLKKAGIRSDLLAAQYGVSTGQAQRGYERQLELEKTGLARGQAGPEGFTGAAGGLTSGLTSALDAYTKYKTAQEGSTTATKEGFYTSQLGGASAYDTAPSNLKFYTGKGWSLG